MSEKQLLKAIRKSLHLFSNGKTWRIQKKNLGRYLRLPMRQYEHVWKKYLDSKLFILQYGEKV